MSEARHQRFEIDIDEIERQLRQSADLAPPAKADPLAELARIVGQNDPFRGILGERRGSEPQAPMPDRAANVHVLGRGSAEPPAPYMEPGPAFGPQGDGRVEPAIGSYDPVASAYGDPDATYAEEDMQPLRPRRSRGRLLAVLCGLVVTSAAVGGGLYWQKSGGRIGFSGAPPVITADKSPLKVAPSDPGGVEVPNQDRQIYERKANEGQSRVVDTREQPVDVREVARTLPTTAPDASPARGRPGAAPGSSVSSVLGEPRRVRTVAVRPDGSIYAPPGGEPTPSDVSPALMPGSPPPAVPVATVSIPGRGGVETPAAPAPAPAPAPMSIQPQVAEAPESSGELGPAVQVLPPRRPKLAALTPAAPSSDEKPADAKPAEDKGKFVVQVAVKDNEGEARSAWNGLMEKFPGDLEGRHAQVNKAEVKGKTVYRVRVGPLAKAEADSLCGKLKSSGGTCFVAAGTR